MMVVIGIMLTRSAKFLSLNRHRTFIQAEFEAFLLTRHLER